MNWQWGARVAREVLHPLERLRSGPAPFFCSGELEDQSIMYQNAMRRESRAENTGCIRSLALEYAQGGRIQGFVTQEIGSGVELELVIADKTPESAAGQEPALASSRLRHSAGQCRRE